jgi:hypothetical protein
MRAHDGEAFFFEDRSAAIFCPICGTLLARNFLPNSVRPKKKWDICSTYENRKIVTQNFKEWCERFGFTGLQFRQVCDSPPYYHFWPSRELSFDSKRAHTQFMNRCVRCGNYESVIGASPLGLIDVSQPIDNGFFRTDLEFGSRWEKSPLIIVGIGTKELMEQEGFERIHFEPVEALSRADEIGNIPLSTDR